MGKKPSYKELEAAFNDLKAKYIKLKQNDKSVIRALSEGFEQLADRSQDAIYQFDIESGTFPFFNRRFLDLYGIRSETGIILSSRSTRKHIHPDDVKILREARRCSLESEDGLGEAEYRYINPDGTIRWMHDRWSVIREKNGQPVTIEGFVRDITKRKQAEDELERSRNSALIGSYIVQGQRFRYVNPQFVRITAYTKEELMGMKSMSLVHEDYREKVKENARLMLKGKRTSPYEFCIVDKNGNIKWVMETVTSIEFEEKRAIMGYFMDVTRKKQIEEERREKEKLRTILEMAGAVSHELNSPLQTVLTSSEKLAKQGLDENMRKKLTRLIKRNTLKMVEISRKIQNISKYVAKEYVGGEKIVDIDAASKK
jgi:PAS domain S-box-containing protein